MKKEFFLATVEGILVLILIVVLGLCIIFAQQEPPIIKNQEFELNIKPAAYFTFKLSVAELNTFIERTASFVVTIKSYNTYAGDITISVEGISMEMVEIVPRDTFKIGAWETKGAIINLIIPNDPELVGTYTLIVTVTATEL